MVTFGNGVRIGMVNIVPPHRQIIQARFRILPAYYVGAVGAATRGIAVCLIEISATRQTETTAMACALPSSLFFPIARRTVNKLK